MKELNSLTEILDADVITAVTPTICKYEVGIADGVSFNFLSETEAESFRKQAKKPYNNIDFLLCVFYRYKRSDFREIPLWSDFQHTRFQLKEVGILEIRMHHFKGTRKLTLDILIRKIVERLNQQAEKRGLKPFRITKLVGR